MSHTTSPLESFASVTLNMTPRDFTRVRHLRTWIVRNQKSARDRLVRYDDQPRTDDEIANARNRKLAAAAESSLVQWGVYKQLIERIMDQEPRDPELFDGIDQEEDDQKEGHQTQEVGKEEGRTEEAEPGQVQPVGTDSTHPVGRIGPAAGEDPEDRDDEGPGG